MADLDIGMLRTMAVRASLRAPVTLGEAISELGFVQADPIRSPARAQDLILRHRVRGYRAGDLERRFPRLPLEEDFLYAYGFMPRETAALLHPRLDRHSGDGRYRPSALASEVLAFVRGNGPTHPRQLEARFGTEQAVNGWGGLSRAATRALQSLHHHGFLRVAKRQNGIRIYEAVPDRPEPQPPEERRRRLVLLVMGLLAPMPQRSLAPTLTLLARGTHGLGGLSATVQDLLKTGELEMGVVDGETYLWPAGMADQAPLLEPPRGVRILAPFDPIVWDRRRFEHLWGWPYRFEAYTPAEKRQFGYYAMPLLWRDRVIGWVNAAAGEAGLSIDTGFAGRRPGSRDFRRAFDAEAARFRIFLGRPGSGDV